MFGITQWIINAYQINFAVRINYCRQCSNNRWASEKLASSFITDSIAGEICLISSNRRASLALLRVPPTCVTIIPDKMPIMAITINSSIKVKPELIFLTVIYFLIYFLFNCIKFSKNIKIYPILPIDWYIGSITAATTPPTTKPKTIIKAGSNSVRSESIARSVSFS